MLNFLNVAREKCGERYNNFVEYLDNNFNNK